MKKKKKLDIDNLLEKTENLCQLYGIKPSRSKGQNFLVNPHIYSKIIELAKLKKDDTVLEVGPGLGFLTVKLAESAGKVLAVELDDKLSTSLQHRLNMEHVKNVEVANQNILDFDLSQLPKNYKVVANLPYNITSVFLRKFLETDHQPEYMVLMLQQEVAERIVAEPGKMSLLAASVQLYSTPQLAFKVPAADFYPQPKVNSAVVRLDLASQHDLPLKGPEQYQLFFRLLKFGFSSKRKMLKNNLAAGLKMRPAEMEQLLAELKMNPKVRAQDLSLADWYKLFGGIIKFMV